MQRSYSSLRAKIGGCWIVALMVLALHVAGIVSAATNPAKPNVILVLTDDQGYGDLSCHGNPILKTPYLDRLYQESVRFTDFHVSPMCAPTRGQLLTGLDAAKNGCINH